jgi:hypothetical protein
MEDALGNPKFNRKNAKPPESRDQGKGAHGKELSKERTTDIPKQRLSEFRKLA